MRNLFFLAALVVTPILSGAAPMIVDLSHGLKTHLLSVVATTTGKSYKDKALRLTITNKSGSAMRVRMNAAVIFEADSAGMQPLVLAGEEMMLLAPFKEGILEVQTFCANSLAVAPYGGISYTYSHVGSDTLVKLLQYVKKHGMLDDLGQSAVWVLTNDHPLNDVYDPYRSVIAQKLIDYLTTLTGKAAPDYYVKKQISTTPGESVYSDKTLKIYAQFEHSLSSPAKLTLGIFNQDGTMIQTVFADRTFGKANHRHKVEFEAGGVKPGAYYIRLLKDDEVLQEKRVEVE